MNALAGFFSTFVVQLGGSVLLVLGILVALYFVDLRLGLAFTTIAGLALVLLPWVRRFGTEYWNKERECSAAFYGYVGEMIAATEDLRALGAVPYALRRFFVHRRNWLPIALRADLWGGLIWMTAVALFTLGDATAYGLGGRLYQIGSISLGQVYLVVAYVGMLAAPIENIRLQLQELQKADASLIRVQELLKAKSQLQDGTEIIPTGALTVEFRAVSFEYQDEPSRDGNQPDSHAPVLNHVSFRLDAGRVLGLLGRTGSGKTTMARLLFRLYDPQVGEIYIGGVKLCQAQLTTLRKRIGLVTQDVQLFETSLRDNITLFDPDISDKELVTVLEALGLKPWIECLPNGLDTRISSASLSAGEAQLVALARVFIKDPGLVILDEASSRLDPATESLLEQALDKLLEGRTAIIIAHRLTTIDRADQILVLDHGQILEHGPREQLYADRDSRFAQLRHEGFAEALA